MTATDYKLSPDVSVAKTWRNAKLVNLEQKKWIPEFFEILETGESNDC